MTQANQSPLIGNRKWSEKKGNILPSLLPAAAKELQKKIAGEWNSKRSAKDIDEDVFYVPSDVDYASIEDVVKHTGAKKYSAAAAKYRASKQIRIAEFTKKVTLICPNTGINAVLDIPATPGYYMPYENPLSNIQNARALVQKGFSYLSKLDTQILAGLLIILADDYNLFQYPVFSNGTSKNALLRSAGKDELIKALLYIEEKIHSENYSILPRLSFIPDPDSKQWTMEVRLNNWLRLVQKELEAPTIVFEAPAKPQSGLQKAREERKIEAAAEKNARKALLSFNRSLDEGIKSVKTLYKDGLINQKLRNLLIGLMDKDVFATLDATTKAKVSLKLATFPIESRITDLIKIFDRDVISTKAEDVLEAIDSPATIQAPVKIKSAFELQNSPEVIKKQKEEFLAVQSAKKEQAAKIKFIQDMLEVGRSVHPQDQGQNQNVHPQNNILLLSHDKSVGTGYDAILLNGQPIPEGSYKLQAIREAFDRVKNYKEPAASQDNKKQELAMPAGEKQMESVAQTEIAPGIFAPTLLWNSMNDFRKRIYIVKAKQSAGIK